MQGQLKDQQTKDRILEQASDLFMQIGVRSVTMDDIANELGISKKTIYLHFKNKADIVENVSSIYCLKNQQETDEIIAQSKNAIDELVRIMDKVVNTFKSMAPNLIYEMQKYYPRSWELFQHHENEYILEKVQQNLRQGISEGLYRSDIDVEIVSIMRVAQIDTALNNQIFPRRRFSQINVQKHMLEIYLRGISTPKGQALIERYFSEQAVRWKD